MKVAVLGGGTAGFMAASHLTKFFPQMELYHIYDPSIPTIGVGESTTPDFQAWIHYITDGTGEVLAQRSHMTRKYQIRFENWGTTHNKFMHNFYPVGEQFAYHVDAALLVDVLNDYVTAERIHQRVTNVHSTPEQATLTFIDGSMLSVDFLFDARGFPKVWTDDYERVEFIPTNAAYIRQGPPVSDNRSTRAVARPHGWIFIIPLTSRTAYGYIYNRDISTEEAVAEDMEHFFAEDGATPHAMPPNRLTFPNFTTKTFFDGSVFRIGNSASFLEPLEATAISFALTQIKKACKWPLKQVMARGYKPVIRAENIEFFNQYLYAYFRRLGFFIGWHYAKGAKFKSPFWDFARDNFATQIAKPQNQELLHDFAEVAELGGNMPHPILAPDAFNAEIERLFRLAAEAEMAMTKQMFPQPVRKYKYALFSPLSFAEVGQGIGHFEATPVAMS